MRLQYLMEKSKNKTKVKFLFIFIIINYKGTLSYADNMHAPPTAFIFSSADFEKNFALTMTGCLGMRPLPRSL